MSQRLNENCISVYVHGMYEVDPSYKVGDVFEQEEEVIVAVGDPIVNTKVQVVEETKQVQSGLENKKRDEKGRAKLEATFSKLKAIASSSSSSSSSYRAPVTGQHKVKPILEVSNAVPPKVDSRNDFSSLSDSVDSSVKLNAAKKIQQSDEKSLKYNHIKTSP